MVIVHHQSKNFYKLQKYLKNNFQSFSSNFGSLETIWGNSEKPLNSPDILLHACFLESKIWDRNISSSVQKMYQKMQNSPKMAIFLYFFHFNEP